MAKSSIPVAVRPGDSATVTFPRDVSSPTDARGELLVAELGPARALRFFAEDRDLRLDPSPLDARVVDVPGGVELTVTARALVRDAIVYADRLDPEAEVDDQIVTLLPGEAHTFRVSTSVPARDPRWMKAPVLRTVNDLRAADDSEATTSTA